MKNNEVKVSNPEDAPGRGRPTRYLPEFADVAYRQALLGKTDPEIAETLGVSKTTLNTWKKRYPEFLSAVKAGKEMADGNVAYGLYRRATGYDYPQEKLFLTKDGDVIRETVMVHVPADPGAGMNWLKNRQRDLWSDKHQIEHTGDMIVTMNLKGGDAGKNETGEQKELPIGWDSFEIQNELDGLDDE